MLRSDLCDYSDAYIVVKRTITVADSNDAAYDKKLTFKNDAPLIYCISKINNTLTDDNAKGLDIAMPMHNLIECSKTYSNTSGSLRNYYRDEPNSGAEGNINYSIKNSKTFDYKTSITGKLEDANRTKNAETGVPLKYLTNFWKTLGMSLINSEVSLILSWSENCVITSKATREKVNGDNPVAGINNPTGATFKIIDTKLYIPVSNLSNQDNNKLLEQLKQDLKELLNGTNTDQQ